jgi:hypothetical protein
VVEERMTLVRTDALLVNERKKKKRVRLKRKRDFGQGEIAGV